jgi:hypothetical protein
MNRAALVVVAALTLATAVACPGGGESAPTRLWLDAREGATPVLALEHPPRF